MPLGGRRDFGDSRYIGVVIPFTTSIEDYIELVMDQGFDFVVSWLVDPDHRIPSIHERRRSDGSIEPPMKPETVMHTMVSGHISNQIVGRISDWIDPDDPLNPDSSIMSLELSWAGHLTCQACILPCPKHVYSPNYAQCIMSYVSSPTSSVALWMTIPVLSKDVDDDDTWEMWNSVRFQCNHHSRLGVVLEVGSHVPDIMSLERWWGEPVKAIIFKNDAFVWKIDTTTPSMSVNHIQLLKKAFLLGIQIIVDLQGDDMLSMLGKCHRYLSDIFIEQPPLSEDDVLEMPYRDYLQAPLQPLQDNLESQTYETFERDSPKYIAYEQAIYCALEDPETSFSSAETVVVMVVGAGRGPLVAKTLSAAQRANRSVQVFAVEKNQNAVVHLYARSKAEGWGNSVQIVHADMRSWNPTFQADVLVSELLGSFGDNELSPECLDGAQKFLKPIGISIPSSYSSYLSPITASKAWTEVQHRDSLEHFETPFVVRLHRVSEIAPPKKAFTFHHPNMDGSVIDNTRYRSLEFVNARSHGMTCHGFAGYFDAVLYKDVMLSIHPDTHTPDMHSWFPIFFPVSTPFYVPAGQHITASMWRKSNSTRVWYEWSISRPTTVPIHNPNGRSYHVGL
ncbi:Protein arginine N-methyltransferase 1.5 [Picochlorum sp. SENEW3]|nr:Protein arginine N-methyltransferase 1.5 [Picochlorum sp. SENEW3]